MIVRRTLPGLVLAVAPLSAPAPALTSVTPYDWQLGAPVLPILQAPIMALAPAEAERIKATLTRLAEDPSGGGSLSGVGALRAGFLLREHLAAQDGRLAGRRGCR
jgi:hypothetical protein